MLHWIYDRYGDYIYLNENNDIKKYISIFIKKQDIDIEMRLL